ncbi:MAG TPA: fumarylacetoacetate hydrolase family protein [Gaiellaceae bacterium]|jgi:2-keto-4-pentenoate hydratase/2-oxohepta-3-ene-1,7-dioic acid hydratase in catechol pathway
MPIPDGQHALGSFADGERAFPGLVLPGERVLDLSGRYPSTRAIFEDWEAASTALAELASSSQESRPLEVLRVLPPAEPRQILQSGANYHRHVVELVLDQGLDREPGMTDEEHRAAVTQMMDERVRSGEPYVFLGAVTALCGPYDEVILPERGERHDWELELAAVIAPGGRHIPLDRALEHVAGYTIANDVTTRDLVHRPDLKGIGSDWTRSKNAPTFLPTGPWVVPAGFVDDPMDLRIRLSLNGDVMQDESTADMIFDVARLVSYASSLVELLPGDLLLTGSPAGNGTHYNRFLREGDVLEGEITGLGAQRNVCRSEVPAPVNA